MILDKKLAASCLNLACIDKFYQVAIFLFFFVMFQSCTCPFVIRNEILSSLKDMQSAGSGHLF